MSAGGSEPFFAAIALSLTAANKLTKAINSYMQPRKASGCRTTQAVTRTPTGGTDEESVEDLRERLQALWMEEIADAYFDPNYMTDAQWTICGKVQGQPALLTHTCFPPGRKEHEQ